MRPYHLYRNGRPAVGSEVAAQTPLWPGRPLLDGAAVHLLDGGIPVAGVNAGPLQAEPETERPEPGL